MPSATDYVWTARVCVQGGGSDGENPKAAAVREQLRKRLSEQEEKERATKTELVQKAASYLEQFYEVSQGAILDGCTTGVGCVFQSACPARAAWQD